VAIMPVYHPTGGDLFSQTLSPLPRSLSVGLIPVAVFGILSFVATTCLLFLLTFRMVKWNRRSRQINQFIILIYNLLLADLQQSLAFLLNAQWLAQDGIQVGTSTCWAQGCRSRLILCALFDFLVIACTDYHATGFVSTGDMGSGIWVSPTTLLLLG
jgi:hypothetical protein